jgi:hypothetical protein
MSPSINDWRIASTTVSSQEARTTRRGGRIISPPRRSPAGLLHAYLAGDDSTACGQPLAPLRKWPARRFLRGFSRRRCRACVDFVRPVR